MVRDIWAEFLSIARQEAGSRVVETWFKAVSLQTWDARERIVYLQAPNTFVKDWIKAHYYQLIELHLKRLLNVPDLKIVLLDPSKSHDTVLAQLKKELEPQTVPAVIPAIAARSTAAPLIVARKSLSINHSYSFDTFVVGPNNQLAYAAAKAVSEKPATIYNPLFIYGESGLGKTHLLHAIAHAVKERDGQASILYQTADRFVNEFIHAIRFDKVHKFQLKYKHVDVLLIDDIQFIANKEQTQEAFFHIFNALHDAHKQIVFSSDAIPQDMQGLAQRLRYRLAWGLVVDMHSPTLETKIAILKKKADVNNQALTDEVAHYIASVSLANVRELEGAFIRVMAFATITGQPVTLELTQKVLQRQHQAATAVARTVEFDRIIRCVKKHYHYNLTDLQSKQRSKELSFVRHVTMFLMKKMTDKSLRDIGLFLGGRDHSTVMHALEKVESEAAHNRTLATKLKGMQDEILQAG